MSDFEKQDSSDTPNPKGAARTEEIEGFIQEELDRLDREEAKKAEKRTKRAEASRSEGSAVIQRFAAEIARETVESQLRNALAMAEAPEAARSILMDETIEKIRASLMTPEDIAKAQTDERIARLLAHIESSVINEARGAVVAALSEKMDDETDPAKISKYHKLIEAVENGR